MPPTDTFKRNRSHRGGGPARRLLACFVPIPPEGESGWDGELMHRHAKRYAQRNFAAGALLMAVTEGMKSWGLGPWQLVPFLPACVFATLFGVYIAAVWMMRRA